MITLKKQGNIGTTEIRMAEDKVRGIEEIAAQLLRENPDLIQPQYAANEDVAPSFYGLSLKKNPGRKTQEPL